jgi:RNA polymerase sigma factor (sigma-70 family)
MKDLCTGCNKRDNCVELCQNAEDWANQDYIEKHWRLTYIGSLDRLDWLANSEHIFPLSLKEMQTEDELNLQDWKFVEEECNLTEQQMQCLYLYYWEKHTQKEIGEKLGIARVTVTKHIKYAKKKLTKMLKSE